MTIACEQYCTDDTQPNSCGQDFPWRLTFMVLFFRLLRKPSIACRINDRFHDPVDIGIFPACVSKEMLTFPEQFCRDNQFMLTFYLDSICADIRFVLTGTAHGGCRMCRRPQMTVRPWGIRTKCTLSSPGYRPQGVYVVAVREDCIAV